MSAFVFLPWLLSWTSPKWDRTICIVQGLAKIITFPGAAVLLPWNWLIFFLTNEYSRYGALSVSQNTSTASYELFWKMLVYIAGIFDALFAFFKSNLYVLSHTPSSVRRLKYAKSSSPSQTTQILFSNLHKHWRKFFFYLVFLNLALLLLLLKYTLLRKLFLCGISVLPPLDREPSVIVWLLKNISFVIGTLFRPFVYSSIIS